MISWAEGKAYEHQKHVVSPGLEDLHDSKILKHLPKKDESEKQQEDTQ
jgi:hypothetical protein